MKGEFEMRELNEKELMNVNGGNGISDLALFVLSACGGVVSTNLLNVLASAAGLSTTAASSIIGLVAMGAYSTAKKGTCEMKNSTWDDYPESYATTMQN